MIDFSDSPGHSSRSPVVPESMFGKTPAFGNINSLSSQTGSIPVGTSAGMVGATQASSGFLSTFGSSTSPLGASSAPAFGSSSSSSFVFPPCGQKHAFGSFAPFGALSHPVAARNRTFDTATVPTFANSTTPFFDSIVTSTLGNPSAPPNKNSLSSQTGPIPVGTSAGMVGATQASSGFFSTFGSSTSPLGASSAPAFGSSSSSFFVFPPCGQKCACESFPPFGASSHPVAASNRTFDTTAAPAFATSTTPLFDSTITSTLGNPSAANDVSTASTFVSGIASPASSSFPFGASRAPAFGSSSPFGIAFQASGNSSSGASTTPSAFGVGSACPFCQSTSVSSGTNLFGTSTSTSGTQISPLGTQTMGAAFVGTGLGQSVFDRQRGGSSTSPLGASSTPAFGSSSSSFVFPPCGQKCACGSFSPFGASSHPVAASNRTFDTTAAPAFATSTTPLFDSTITSTLGNPSAANDVSTASTFVSGIASPASSSFPFGASSAPAFGSSSPFGIAFQASSNSSSGASTTPSVFGVGSTCPFCHSTSGTRIPPLGGCRPGQSAGGIGFGPLYSSFPFGVSSSGSFSVTTSTTPSIFGVASCPALRNNSSLSPFNSFAFSSFPATSAQASAPGAANAPAPGLNFVPSEGQMNVALRQTSAFGHSSTIPLFGQPNTITIPISPIGYGQILLTSTPIFLHPGNIVGFGQTNPNFFTLLQPVNPFFISNSANSPAQFLHSSSTRGPLFL